MKAIAILLLLTIATGCRTQKSCHSKGSHIPKSIKKQQSRPRN